MKSVNFMLRAMLLAGLLIGASAAAQPPPCADVNGDGNSSISDLAELIDGMYVSGDLDSARAELVAGLDGYEGVTSHDIMWLIKTLFIDFTVAPPCNTNEGWPYPGCDDTLKFSDLFVPAGADTCTVDVLIDALSEFHTLAIAFEYGLGGDDIEYLGAEWLIQAGLSEFGVHDAATNRLALSFMNLFPVCGASCLESMCSFTPIVRLTFVVTPSTEDRVISITPVDWQRGYTLHTTVLSRFDEAEGTMDGTIPVIMTYEDNPDEDGHGNFCFGGTRGNIDGSWDQIVDITDLQVLIDYQFISLEEPLALGEADVAPPTGADGIVDVSDVSAMVDHLFLSLADLPACDECTAAKRLPRLAGSLRTVHENGRTILSLTSGEELRGLQLALRGDQAQPVATSPLAGSMDLIVGQHDSELLVGLIDLDGPGTIPAGDCKVLELDGTYEVISASGASLDHITVALSLGAEGNLPVAFALDQNYPNPFNPATDIGFSVPVRGQVQLVVYNTLGQQVTTLVNKVLEAGPAKVTWDGTDRAGNTVASGVYFYRLTVGDQSTAKKMLLLK